MDKIDTGRRGNFLEGKPIALHRFIRGESPAPALVTANIKHRADQQSDK